MMSISLKDFAEILFLLQQPLTSYFLFVGTFYIRPYPHRTPTSDRWSPT